MSWDPLTEADQLAISAVVHQGYFMPDVFWTVARIVREHLRDAHTPTTTADPERAALAEGSDA